MRLADVPVTVDERGMIVHFPGLDQRIEFNDQGSDGVGAETLSAFAELTNRSVWAVCDDYGLDVRRDKWDYDSDGALDVVDFQDASLRETRDGKKRRTGRLGA